MSAAVAVYIHSGEAQNAAGEPAGFSLLELIVVLTILAVMAGAVVPVYNTTFRNVRSDYYVRDLVTLMKYAHERAVTDTTYYRLYFKPEEDLYWLARWGEEDGEWDWYPMEEKQAAPRTLKPPITLGKVKAYEDRDRKASYITFYPSGTCDPDCSVEVLRDGEPVATIGTTGRLGIIEVDEE